MRGFQLVALVQPTASVAGHEGNREMGEELFCFLVLEVTVSMDRGSGSIPAYFVSAIVAQTGSLPSQSNRICFFGKVSFIFIYLMTYGNGLRYTPLEGGLFLACSCLFDSEKNIFLK